MSHQHIRHDRLQQVNDEFTESILHCHKKTTHVYTVCNRLLITTH